jgi:aminocarboxymuconate-semialdehyde decarboxylase
MTIDTHAHYFPPAMLDMLEHEARQLGVSFVKNVPACTCALHFEHGLKLRPFPALLIEDVSARLSGMDRQRIDRQVLSAWADAFGYGLPKDKAIKWHRRLNLAMADLVAKSPDRFSFLASVPLPHAAEAAEELSFAMRELGAVGAVLCTNIEDVNLGDFPLDDFWSAAVALDAGVLLHPAAPSQGAGRAGRFGLAQIAQYTYDSTLCIGSLIFTGVLDRFPALRLLTCHGGGTYPYLAGRFDIMHARTDRKAMGNVAAQPPSHYLGRMYYDTILHSPSTLRFLADEVGVDRVVLGTDYSFPPADDDPLDTLRRARFSPAETALITDTNPRHLFPQLDGKRTA